MKLSRNEKGLGKTKFFQKKEVILILTILLFASTIYAACDITDTIDKGATKNYTANGKDYAIKFSSLKNESGDVSVKFAVNGVSTSDLEEGGKYSFEDLSDLTISSISIGSGTVNTTAQICFNGGLKSYGKGTCSSSSECDDSNSCTIDECDGDPLRCRHKLILWCRDDDLCCPESRCTAEQDSDCNIVDECTLDSDCDDNNLITKDICNNTTKKCKHTEIAECTSGDNFCPVNCTYTLDTDCDECSIDDDCDDSNACTSDTCSGAPKRCLNNATSGCDLIEECVSVGTRVDDKFCHTDNTMKPLRSKKEYCDNDYECLTNQCTKNKCKGQGFIKAITNWLKGLFGKK